MARMPPPIWDAEDTLRMGFACCMKCGKLSEATSSISRVRTLEKHECFESLLPNPEISNIPCKFCQQWFREPIPKSSQRSKRLYACKSCRKSPGDCAKRIGANLNHFIQFLDIEKCSPCPRPAPSSPAGATSPTSPLASLSLSSPQSPTFSGSSPSLAHNATVPDFVPDPADRGNFRRYVHAHYLRQKTANNFICGLCDEKVIVSEYHHHVEKLHIKRVYLCQSPNCEENLYETRAEGVRHFVEKHGRSSNDSSSPSRPHDGGEGPSNGGRGGGRGSERGGGRGGEGRGGTSGHCSRRGRGSGVGGGFGGRCDRPNDRHHPYSREPDSSSQARGDHASHSRGRGHGKGSRSNANKSTRGEQGTKSSVPNGRSRDAEGSSDASPEALQTQPTATATSNSSSQTASARQGDGRNIGQTGASSSIQPFTSSTSVQSYASVVRGRINGTVGASTSKQNRPTATASHAASGHPRTGLNPTYSATQALESKFRHPGDTHRSSVKQSASVSSIRSSTSAASRGSNSASSSRSSTSACRAVSASSSLSAQNLTAASAYQVSGSSSYPLVDHPPPTSKLENFRIPKKSESVIIDDKPVAVENDASPSTQPESSGNISASALRSAVKSSSSASSVKRSTSAATCHSVGVSSSSTSQNLTATSTLKVPLLNHKTTPFLYPPSMTQLKNYRIPKKSESVIDMKPTVVENNAPPSNQRCSPVEGARFKIGESSTKAEPAQSEVAASAASRQEFTPASSTACVKVEANGYPKKSSNHRKHHESVTLPRRRSGRPEATGRSTDVKPEVKHLVKLDDGDDNDVDAKNFGCEKIVVLKSITTRDLQKLMDNKRLKEILEEGMRDHVIFLNAKMGILRLKSKKFARDFLDALQDQRIVLSIPNMSANVAPETPSSSNQICIWGTESIKEDHSLEELKLEIDESGKLRRPLEFSNPASACLASYEKTECCVNAQNLHRKELMGTTLFVHYV